MFPISIIGATGYTGIELIKIIKLHPQINLKYIVSNSSAGNKLSEIYPHFQNICEQELISLDQHLDQIISDSDTIFLALPHGKSQEVAEKLIGKVKIIDLSADYRLNPEFTYSIPEINKEQTKQSSQVANPGCFATTIQLALAPIKNQIEQASIQGITGSSGSGKSASATTHHPVRNHNLKSYKIATHQHLAEINNNLELNSNQITFVPTSGPFTRGIHITAFVTLKENHSLDQIQKTYSDFYHQQPFIRIKDAIQLADVVGSNFCDISIHQHQNQLIVQSTIDNLIKGAAGNAIHNFNLIHNLPETTGLNSLLPLYP